MPRLIKLAHNDKMPTLPLDLEVINGKVVITMGVIVRLFKRIVTNVIGRFVYDWLKNHFQSGN